MNMKLRLEQRT